MAHTKATGKSKNGRNSPGQRLGIKLFAGQPVHAGQIIARQRGTKWRAGENVKIAKDDTLYAALNGVVRFSKRSVKDFTGRLIRKTFVHVDPAK